MLKKIILLSLLLSSISSCSYDSKHINEVTMENHFTLIKDSRGWFPHQPDYFEFLKSGYIDTYYYKNEDGFNVHYYLEFLDSSIVDVYGTYVIENNKITLDLKDYLKTTLIFNHSEFTSVEYLLIGYINYDDFNYYLLYEAEYQITAKG